MGKSFLTATFLIIGTFSSNASAKIMMMHFSPFATMNELQFYSGLYESLDNRGHLKEIIGMSQKDKIEFFDNLADAKLSVTIPRSDIEELKDLNTPEFISCRLGEDVRSPFSLMNNVSGMDKKIKAEMHAYFTNDANFKNGLHRESVYTRIADFFSDLFSVK